MKEEIFLTVAKQIYDNLPFTNKDFNPQSVNEASERLKVVLKNEGISEAWIMNVYKAAENNQPIYIDFNHDKNWNFLTMKSGTRQDILDKLAEIDVSKMKLK